MWQSVSYTTDFKVGENCFFLTLVWQSRLNYEVSSIIKKGRR